MQEAGDHMIDAKNLTASELNTKIRESDADVIEIQNILGQRYIANASNGKKIKLFGTCGNNLGSFLDGSEIEVFGNVQDACANTMNDGKIILHGMCGDALGYGMRGGKIFVEKDCGSRCGIHMKATKTKQPLMIIGGVVQDFFGEYLSGGTLIVLNLQDEASCCGRYCGCGAHGGSIILRLSDLSQACHLTSQLKKVDDKKKAYIDQALNEYANDLHITLPKTMDFYEVIMQNKNPYERLYVEN